MSECGGCRTGRSCGTVDYYLNLSADFSESFRLSKKSLSRVNSEAYCAECQMVIVDGSIRGIVENGGLQATAHVVRMEYRKHRHGDAVTCDKQRNDNDLRDSTHT